MRVFLGLCLAIFIGCTSEASSQLSTVSPEDEVTVSEYPEVERRLRESIRKLSQEIGERNLGRYEKLNQTADWIEKCWTAQGYNVSRQTFQVRGLDCHNLIVEIVGNRQPDEIVIVGAHYDTAVGTPGANDNGTGVAALLELSEQLKGLLPERTLRFVAFTNEEPPYFQRPNEMGSWVYAHACMKAKEKIIGVISLETMGYFSDEPNSQNYPPMLAPLYPSEGNFIGFVSNVESRKFLLEVLEEFKKHSTVPSEFASLPSSVPGVGWSDHWSFWEHGYAGLMITDTAPFRYPHYHAATDTLDKIEFKRFTGVVNALVPVVKKISEATDK
jgi:hypothetical protein